MRFRLRTILIAACALSVCAAALSPFLKIAYQRMARMDEVRTKLDHESIRDAVPSLLQSLGGNFSIAGDADLVPENIKATDPVRLIACEDWVRIEYGDGHGHFGLEIAPMPGMNSLEGEQVAERVFYYQTE